MTWVGTYILNDKGEPEPAESLEWALWYEKADRHVADTKLESGVRISTVFLGLDHNFLRVGPAVLWESLILGGPHALTMRRYTSRAAAELGHQDLVRLAQEEWNLDVLLNEGRIQPKSIMCPKCGKVSWSPDDVRYKYCGNCHAFHEDLCRQNSK